MKVLVGLTVAVSLAAPAAAFGGTQLWEGAEDEYVVKPIAFFYTGTEAGRPGATYEFAKVRWRGWAQTSSLARGRLKVCANRGKCRRMRVRMRAYRKRPLCDDATEFAYTRLRVRSPELGGGKATLKLPPRC